MAMAKLAHWVTTRPRVDAREAYKDAIRPQDGRGRATRLIARLTALAILGAVGAVAVTPAHAATTFIVNSTNDPGVGVCDPTECTLREAINAANSAGGADSIEFNIPGSLPHSITPTSALPPIIDPVVIDATTEPDFVSCADGPTVEIDGSLAGASANGFWLAAPSTVRGLAINDFASPGRAGILADTPGGHVIECNYIGTDATGVVPKPNTIGVFMTAASTIGGTNASARNVLSGNLVGIYVASSGGTIQGNYIGTDSTGTADVGNTFEGLFLDNAVAVVTGGVAAGAGNVISGNNSYGVRIQGPNNQVLGNLIGTAANGTSPLGNSASGVHIGPSGGASGNQVGGTAAGAGNVIAYNGNAGVAVQDNANNIVNNPLLGNAIHDNAGLGIDLGGSGVTPNDAGDADLGANKLQNFPVLTSSSSSGGTTTVQGTLDSTASTTFRVEFFSSPTCDPSGFGEGKVFLGFETVTTDGTGNASFTATVPTGTIAGDVVTSTATDPGDNTSEFSNCTVSTGGPGPPASLTLSPKTATNTVDTWHCVTATVTDTFGNPTAGITVRFTVTGSRNTMGTAVTNANGQATFCYLGPALPGSDTISAFADTNGNGARDTGEPSDTASKIWTLPSSSAACKVTNGGGIVAANGDKATFGGNAQDGPKGNEEYQDHGPASPMNVKAINVQAIVCSADMKSASIFGQATINGVGVFNYRIDVRDLGEPGKTDTYRIRLSNGYDSGDKVLSQGNIQIHK